MKDYFDVLTAYFDIFSDSDELTGLLGTNPSDIAECDDRLRKSFADSTLVEPSELPFVDFSFIVSHGQTGNFLVNREVVEFNIYCSNFNEASLIFKAIKKLLRANYKDAQCISSNEKGTVTGLYCFSFRIKTFIGT